VSSCAVCGTANATDANVCAGCGSSLRAPASSREQRKTVSVLFCDVVGSTALGEQTDPEALRALLARYFERMKAIVEGHGGTVEKFIGDAVMAVFGVPALHEDDAVRACRAALEMRAVLPELGIRGRIGIGTGEVFTGTAERLATGDAVNVAARLEQAAAPGEALIDATTRTLTARAVTVEEVEPLALKGKERPVSAFRLVALVADAAPTEGRDTAFLGREAELARLRSAFDDAVATRTCRLVSVVAPPGMGKSRLGRELGAILGDEARVVVGRCLAYGEAVTYAPLVEILDQLGGVEAIAGSVGAGEEDAIILERLAAAVGSSDGIALPDETAWAFRRLFEALASERPLLVVVDDVHWAHQTLLDVLEYVVSFASGVAILIVCLARPDLFDEHPDWAAPRANATTIALEPLSDHTTEALIAQMERGRVFGDDARERIVAAAEGNPLFVEHIVALQTEHPDSDLVLPPTIQALLAARIDRLNDPEREVLVRAAVEGRVFHRAAVAQLVSPDVRAGLASHLMSLVRKELLRPDRARFAGDDAFRFSHVLIRDAAYASLAKQLRAELHETYAWWLEPRLDGRDDYLEIVGFHLEQAWRYHSELGEGAPYQRLQREAGERLWAAGRAASARMDFGSAANLLGRAEALLPDEPTGSLSQERGAALNRAGDGEAAAEVVERAIARAHASGSRSVELRARLDRFWMPRPITVQQQYATLAEARTLIPDLEALGDDLGLTKAWQVVALGDHALGRHAASEHALEIALRHARLVGDRVEESEIRVSRLYTWFEGAVPTDELLERSERELRDARGDWMIEAAVRTVGGAARAMRGELEAGRADVLRTASLCAEFSIANVFPFFELWRVELLAGDLAAAEEALRARGTLRFSEFSEWYGLRFALDAMLAQTLCLQERYDEAAALTAALPAGVTDWLAWHVLWRRARAKALVRLGLASDGVALAEEAVALAEPTDDLDLRAGTLLDRAEVLGAVGRTADAAADAAAARRLYEQKGNLVMAGRAALEPPRR
jgi:class 3 adenylate cyclase